jgi:uncharacterized heparinase superfamily protein
VKPFIEVEKKEPEIVARTGAFRSKSGVEIERRVTLLSGGETLVGRDRLIASGGRQRFSSTLVQRFHLAPGATAQRSENAGMISIHLQSGQIWSFLWEAANARIEQSVRQSAHIGYHKTQQIVLEAEVGRDVEVAWILTRQ